MVVSSPDLIYTHHGKIKCESFSRSVRRTEERFKDYAPLSLPGLSSTLLIGHAGAVDNKKQGVGRGGGEKERRK